MKVAFSVAFVSGCSSPSSTGGVAEEEDYVAERLASGCHEEAGAPPKLTCEQVVDAAFPTEGNDPGVKKAVSSEVQTCCVELLTKSQGMMESHRWDCCANVDQEGSSALMIACTPWGPPVPPAMRRRGSGNGVA
jgi:hypothetical protein